MIDIITFFNNNYVVLLKFQPLIKQGIIQGKK